MTWIKICGITNLEDGLTAVEAGADALGFVFYEKSPRYIDLETARKIIAKLPNTVEKVGVFADESGGQIQKTTDRVGLTGVQLHVDVSSPGDKTPSNVEPCAQVKRYIAVPVMHFFDDQGQFDGFAQFNEDVKAGELVAGIFLDSGTPQQPGGTGKVFDWAKAAPLVESISKRMNVVVAGGLTPGNVAEAMRILKPWGVDVSSGVEAKPGKKDSEKVRAFIAAVRQADKST